MSIHLFCNMRYICQNPLLCHCFSASVCVIVMCMCVLFPSYTKSVNEIEYYVHHLFFFSFYNIMLNYGNVKRWDFLSEHSCAIDQIIFTRWNRIETFYNIMISALGYKNRLCEKKHAIVPQIINNNNKHKCHELKKRFSSREN